MPPEEKEKVINAFWQCSIIGLITLTITICCSLLARHDKSFIYGVYAFGPITFLALCFIVFIGPFAVAFTISKVVRDENNTYKTHNSID